MTPPLGRLEYLYVGTADFDRDCAYYPTVLGAERVCTRCAPGQRSRNGHAAHAGEVRCSTAEAPMSE
jgi:hypothetical protein